MKNSVTNALKAYFDASRKITSPGTTKESAAMVLAQFQMNTNADPKQVMALQKTFLARFQQNLAHG